ncbi:hypothetical protein EVAR_31321_1 [Eumeta japonica]|uniref:Uncharacterized protein n=1 Tax=Eumeta variegata TaxID=151549 RepID=A0A4C1XWJ9_EUMVA|nr:hypothetical protein EVAR_31321_1 [Eumeta japonica]
MWKAGGEAYSRRAHTRADVAASTNCDSLKIPVPAINLYKSTVIWSAPFAYTQSANGSTETCASRFSYRENLTCIKANVRANVIHDEGLPQKRRLATNAARSRYGISRLL